MSARFQAKPLRTNARADDGQLASQGFENLQARAAANAERHHEHAALREEWANVRHASVQLHAGLTAHPRAQPSRWIPADDAKLGPWFRTLDFWKDVFQQHLHGVLIRSPIKTAQKEDLARIARRRRRPEVRRVHAVFYDVDVCGPVLIPDDPGIFATHGDGARRAAVSPALKALELAPLPADVPAFERVRLVLAIARPNQGFDIVGDHQAAGRGQATQHL